MKQRNVRSASQTNIVSAACKVILDKGAEALTLEAVARAAGISKGGLLYHFPSKNRLIQGMIEHLIAGVETSLEEELRINGGDFLAAYISISIENNPEHNKISFALFAAIANDLNLLKPLQDRYLEWQIRAAAAAPSPEIGTLIRLAMDGLWVSDLLNFAPPSSEMRNKISLVLLSMVQKVN